MERRPLDDFGPRSWTRPEAVAFGRLPMAADLCREGALSLDGTWSFVLRDRPESVTEADLTGPADGWADIEVPGCWTMQGFDRPQYTNVIMPFPGPPPSVPEENPTGVYRRQVTVPAEWAGRRIILHVAGAETVLYVHVDGGPVGMGKDSRLPHELDLTGIVEPGGSFDLALSVVRWSDATYLENQDHWHHAGLHRSIRLYATPPVCISDVRADADFDPETGEGHLSVRVVTHAEGRGPSRWSARVTCAGQVAEGPVWFEHPDPMVSSVLFEGRGAHRLTIDLPGIAPWTAETPNLHDVTVTLLDAEGVVQDEVALAVGFRRVEVRGHELLVNGRPVLIKGVNRHDHDPRRGKAVTPQSIERDVLLMKQHNLNAIRTSHYPSDTHLYDVCDRLGMYVLDEADIESHNYLRSLTKDPRWSLAILERVTRMAARDRNHPSVIMWSLGNESGVSAAHHAAAAWLREWDPGRPVHYESGISEDSMARRALRPTADILGRSRPETDVIAPMYPPVDAIVGWATAAPPERPLIMCEYIHAMGNSCGGFDEYWEAIRTYPGLQGGFIWDWVDQALVQEMPDGTERLAYGGDFGDEPNDGPFCMNGLVSTDRIPHPSLLEATAVLAPVRIEPVDAARGVVSVLNEHFFVDLSWLKPAWVVEVDGDVVGTGTMEPLNLGPGRHGRVTVPFEPPRLEPGQRAYLTLTFSTQGDLPWAPAGHIVARHQLEIGRAEGPADAPGPVVERGMESLVSELALWRAPIDNELFSGVAPRWAEGGLAEGRDHSLATRTDRSAGALLVSHEVEVKVDDVARVGARLHLGPGVDRVEWLGFGPHECYSDRRASALYGRWTLPVDEWPVPYPHPQASGNRVGVRWLRFLDRDGRVLLTIDHLDDADVTVSRHTDQQVAAASHLEDLPASDDCYVWIDARHRGVGSGAVGPDTTPEHRVAPGTYRWSYRLR